jgi:hypothetical protein
MFALDIIVVMKPKRAIKAEPTSADPETVLDLIKTLQGSWKGPGSLLKDRERDHKRDERIKSQKFATMK